VYCAVSDLPVFMFFINIREALARDYSPLHQ